MNIRTPRRAPSESDNKHHRNNKQKQRQSEPDHDQFRHGPTEPRDGIAVSSHRTIVGTPPPTRSTCVCVGGSTKPPRSSGIGPLRGDIVRLTLE